MLQIKSNKTFYIIIAFIILLMISIPVFAGQKEDTCDMQYQMANLIMLMRQSDKSPVEIRNKMQNILKADKGLVELSGILTNLSFEEPLYSSVEGKKRATSKFAGMVYNMCMKATK